MENFRLTIALILVFLLGLSACADPTSTPPPEPYQANLRFIEFYSPF